MKQLIAMLIAASMPFTAHAQAPGDQPEAAADAGDRQICKRFLETGSLVRGYRVCKSKREWEGARDNLRRQFGVSDSCRLRGEGGAC